MSQRRKAVAVPMFTCFRSTREALSFTPAAPADTPQTFSTGYPETVPGGRYTLHLVRAHCDTDPDPPGFESAPHNEASDTDSYPYTFSSRSPSPHHLAVLARPDFVKAACHLNPPIPVDQAALNFTKLL